MARRKPKVWAAKLEAHRLTWAGKWMGREAVEDRDSSPHTREERTLSTSRQGSPIDCRGMSGGVQGS